jgi:nitrite reductase (NADH) small subunit
MKWQTICPLDRIVPSTGVAAKVADKQVAIFRLGDDVFALDNYDPFSGANVISRGIVGDKQGVAKVASPIYKQQFALETGVCLDDESVKLQTYPVEVRDGHVVVGISE